MRWRLALASMLTALGCLAGCAAPLAWQPLAPPHHKIVSVIPRTNQLMVGTYEQGLPETWSGVTTFTTETGIRPKIVDYFSGWGEGFHTSMAQLAHSDGAYLLVQIQPTNISLAKIAAGTYDDYLHSYAEAVRAFGYPVILSFGHEMNGDWYSWGAGHTAPATFVAAWRHIVTVFRDAGATNANWLWAVNSENSSYGPLQPWWPGAAWVNWVGIDGYYAQPTDTFASVFGYVLGKIRAFTQEPLLIAETAVGTTPNRESQIAGLFSGARSVDAVGVVWFDARQNDGLYHQNWRLEDDPVALAAFKVAAKIPIPSPVTTPKATTSTPAGSTTPSA